MARRNERPAQRSGGRSGDAGGRHGGEQGDFPVGAPVGIVHAKPWKRTITMRGIVKSWDGDLLTVERQFSAGGQYDSLHVPKLKGDWGTIEVPRGGRILRRAYYRQDGTLVGELFNIQTPVEFRNGSVYYIALEVDVVRLPGGRVSVVDEDDLAAAVRMGGITREAADQALALAQHLAGILREDGDWRTADTA